jgi:hypothetical protein
VNTRRDGYPTNPIRKERTNWGDLRVRRRRRHSRLGDLRQTGGDGVLGAVPTGLTGSIDIAQAHPSRAHCMLVRAFAGDRTERLPPVASVWATTWRVAARPDYGAAPRGCCSDRAQSSSRGRRDSSSTSDTRLIDGELTARRLGPGNSSHPRPRLRSGREKPQTARRRAPSLIERVRCPCEGVVHAVREVVVYTYNARRRAHSIEQRGDEASRST